MPRTLAQIRSYRRGFGRVFLASIAVLTVSTIVSLRTRVEHYETPPVRIEPVPEPPPVQRVPPSPQPAPAPPRPVQATFDRESFEMKAVVGDTTVVPVILTNTGEINIRPEFKLVADAHSAFALSTQCDSLKPRASCTILVAFNPRQEGTYSAALHAYVGGTLAHTIITGVAVLKWSESVPNPNPPKPTPVPTPPIPTPESQSGNPVQTDSFPVVVLVTSLVTSLTSLLGFVFTTAVAWRKERREQAQADVELEQKKLELEKLRLELRQNKEQSSSTADDEREKNP